jgi:aminotransferase EvaB
LAHIYNDRLSELNLRLPYEVDGNCHVYYVYVVQHPDREKIITHLKNIDIHLNISYPWPIHTMRAYQYLGGKEGDLPVTEKLAKTVFSLPMYPTLEPRDVETVCSELLQFL